MPNEFTKHVEAIRTLTNHLCLCVGQLKELIEHETPNCDPDLPKLPDAGTAKEIPVVELSESGDYISTREIPTYDDSISPDLELSMVAFR